MSDPTLYQRPAELLQKLIQFDTTNPPGNEAACVSFIADLLASAGIPPILIARHPNRPNLIARLSGQGNKPPLLIYGHVDVVTTADQNWTHPPFAATTSDGYIWGRGALDMKGGVSMLLAAFLRAKLENSPLPGDVVLVINPDEEAGGDEGAKFLVGEHKELFSDIRYALSEFGGFTISIGGQRFYPIQVAEKQLCSLKATLRGPGGHGSVPIRGGAMAQLGTLLQKLDQNRLPVHITPIVRQMISGIADHLPLPLQTILRQLLNPRFTNRLLNLMPERLATFAPLLSHTVSPTIVHGGHKINVIPSQIELALDGRLLPGFQPADLLAELHHLTGDLAEWEVVAYDLGPSETDMALFGMLGEVLKGMDSAGIPIPLLLPGVTDARFYAQLGIQTYGFLPMLLPPEFNFSQTIHAADERIPLEALPFGATAIHTALQKF